MLLYIIMEILYPIICLLKPKGYKNIGKLLINVDIPKKIGECINLSEDEAKTLYSLMYKILLNIEKE